MMPLLYCKKYLSALAATFVFLCLILHGLAGCAGASGAAVVRFLEKAEVDTDTVRLGDIAEIQGEEQELIENLRAVVVGKAPLPGRSCEIKQDHIKIRLKQRDFDLSQIVFLEAKKIEVSRSFLEIPHEDLEKIVVDYIYGHAPWNPNNMDVTNIRVRDTVILPKGQVTYAITPLKHDDFLGTTMVPIVFKVGGTVKKKVWGSAEVALFGEVVVTQKPLGRYQLITEDDVCLKRVDVAKMPSNAITELGEVLGKRAKRAINAQVTLNTNLIELPPLVKRGDIVKILARSEVLTVTTIGEIKEKGHRGEQVRVENLGSKREIYARVLDSHTVTVDF
jgi:flagella basal body P-ring formation protein FlgA